MDNKDLIKSLADKLVKNLNNNHFIIQRYDAITNSVYLKLDYGVCNSIRISDHEGKSNLKYRYNLIIGGQVQKILDKYPRYFYDENTIKELFYQILADRKLKLQQYGKDKYLSFMKRNEALHAADKGFWKDAKFVSGAKLQIDPVVPKAELVSDTMADGTTIYGVDPALLSAIKQGYDKCVNLTKGKFTDGTKVKFIVSVDILRACLMTGNVYTYDDATRIAENIILIPANNAATVISTTSEDGENYCSLMLSKNKDLMIVPESFLDFY